MHVHWISPSTNSEYTMYTIDRLLLGLDFGAVYQVMVVAVNNEDFGGQSGMHKVTTAVGNCEYELDFDSSWKKFC